LKAKSGVTEDRNAPLLLTPGPLTTSAETKAAMLRDWGSRDRDFIALTARLRQRLLALANAEASHSCVPLQGSGTFAVEAMLGTLVPRGGKVAVLINGAYGRRMAHMLDRAGRAHVALETPEDKPADPAALGRALAEDGDIGHVAAVHCETTSGILNPLHDIAEVTERHGRKLLVDAMSSFGALDIDAQRTPFAALAASANKCLEGVPGAAFVIVETGALAASEGNAPALSLDLHDQWRGFERNGQWRFTPPTHVLAALDRALDEHAAEQGVAGRGARYERNRQVLVEGMRALGFETLLSDAVQAPIIVTFHMPGHPRFDFQRFYDGLAGRGYVIYPGKLTQAESFRIGCIGRVDEADMRGALDAVRATLDEMGVESGAP
jgi:2-aminoethylphosphonate-pyruvate transaminase